jgi:hypothetical protein
MYIIYYLFIKKLNKIVKFEFHIMRFTLYIKIEVCSVYLIK